MTCIKKSHSKDTLYWEQRLGRYGTYSPEVEILVVSQDGLINYGEACHRAGGFMTNSGRPG